MEPISCPESSETNLRHGTTQQSSKSGFGREVDECCLLLGCYTASGGNSLPKRRGGTDSLHRNVGKGLPLLAAYTTQKNEVFKPAELNYA